MQGPHPSPRGEIIIGFNGIMERNPKAINYALCEETSYMCSLFRKIACAIMIVVDVNNGMD